MSLYSTKAQLKEIRKNDNNGKKETIVMPKGSIKMSNEEMYLEGGAVSTLYKTAKAASSYLSAKAGTYAAAGLAAAYGAATTLETIAGALGFGTYAAMSYKMADNYTSAYNDAQSILANNGNVKCKIQETTMMGIYVSNVTCVRA